MCPCVTKYRETFVRYNGCLFQNATDGFFYKHIFTYVTKSKTQALPFLAHTKPEALEIVNRKEFGENWLETDCLEYLSTLHLTTAPQLQLNTEA